MRLTQLLILLKRKFHPQTNLPHLKGLLGILLKIVRIIRKQPIRQILIIAGENANLVGGWGLLHEFVVVLVFEANVVKLEGEFLLFVLEVELRF